MNIQNYYKTIYCSKCGNIVAATFDNIEISVLCFGCLYRKYECWNCLNIRSDVRYYEDEAQFLCGECYANRHKK